MGKSKSRSMNKSVAQLTRAVVQFRDQRDWKQFHNAKDMVLSLGLEVAELAEHMQWKDEAAFMEHLQRNRLAVAEELADCLYWILLMGNDFGIPLTKAFESKLAKNRRKYPVASARGSSAKYTELKGGAREVKISRESKRSRR